MRSDRKKIVVLGSGPNRIGQGIEFDYCCVHGVLAARELGYETIMINCNPETVSTDFDTADKPRLPRRTSNGWHVWLSFGQTRRDEGRLPIGS